MSPRAIGIALSTLLHASVGTLVMFGMPTFFLYWLDDDQPVFIPVEILTYSQNADPSVAIGAGVIASQVQVPRMAGRAAPEIEAANGTESDQRRREQAQAAKDGTPSGSSPDATEARMETPTATDPAAARETLARSARQPIEQQLDQRRKQTKQAEAEQTKPEQAPARQRQSEPEQAEQGKAPPRSPSALSQAAAAKSTQVEMERQELEPGKNEQAKIGQPRTAQPKETRERAERSRAIQTKAEETRATQAKNLPKQEEILSNHAAGNATATTPKDPLSAALDAVAAHDRRVAQALIRATPPVDEESAVQMKALATVMEDGAKEGYPNAQYGLARMLLQGRVAQPDRAEAMKWLRRAAEKGHVEGQLLYGYLAARGDGKRRDFAEAYLWWSIAAADGDAAAALGCDQIEPLLGPRERREAQALANRWRLLRDALKEPAGSKAEQQAAVEHLQHAAIDGDVSQMRAILARGGDPSGTDKAGRTALINAAWRGRRNTVEALVAVGADLDFRDHDGRTALGWAATNGHAKIAKELIAAGATIDSRDAEGLTPLIRAAWNGYPEAMEALIASGADPRLADTDGKTPLDYARRSGNPAALDLIEKRSRAKP